MAKDTTRTVWSANFVKHGYRSKAELSIEPSRGRYVVTLWLNQPNGERREVAWEPAEPDRQELGIQYAMNDPVEAVLDAIRIDIGRREEDGAA